MIRRLVQQQQVRLARELPHDRQPLPPPAGERLDVLRRVREPRAIEQDRRAQVPLVIVEMRIDRVRHAIDARIAPRRTTSSCGTYPTRSCRRAISSPSSACSSSPAKMRSSVDLPDPFAPISPMRSPSSNPSVMPENSSRGP